MKTNPIVEDVRKTRKQISLKYGNSLKKLVSHYQQLEQSLGCKVHEDRNFRKAV